MKVFELPVASGAGLDELDLYISCSPKRVSVARLAAARAAIETK